MKHPLLQNNTAISIISIGMFNFVQKQTTNMETAQSPESPASPLSDRGIALLSTGEIGRVLELEEKVQGDNFTLKHIEELLVLYAVI